MAGSTSGSYNTAMGYEAQYADNSGLNTALGYQALYSNTSNSNTAVGYQALYLNTLGFQNIAVGTKALQANTTGNRNVSIGYEALSGSTTGSYNVAMGSGALLNTTGSNYVAMGYNALLTNVSGNSNVAIGASADVASSSLTFATAIGSSAIVSSSNTVVLGRTTDYVVIGDTTSGPTQFYVSGTAGGSNSWTHISDLRFKTNIESIQNPVDTIERLRGVTYDWNLKKYPNHGFEPGRQIGFIAQEVEPVVPEVVRTSRSGYKSIQYAQLVALAMEGIKEIAAKVVSLTERHDREIELLKSENALLKARLEKLEATPAGK